MACTETFVPLEKQIYDYIIIVVIVIIIIVMVIIITTIILMKPDKRQNNTEQTVSPYIRKYLVSKLYKYSGTALYSSVLKKS
jgi:hypothetical protein